MENFAQQLAKLTPDAKRNILKRAAEFDLFPLSQGQERMWFLDRVRPDTPNYNMPARIDFRGQLDAAALERALQAVVARHEALRTAFVEFEGVPMQVVQPARHTLERIDLSHLAGEARTQACDAQVLAEARRVFALDAGYLFRTALIRLSDDHHVLVMNMHHIVCDDWSHGVLMREIASAYAHGGSDAALPELSLQFVDYACWQREQLQGDALARLGDYWTRKLAGAPDLLAMPLDHPRPAAQNFKGARLGFSLDRELVQRLERLAREHNATPFMVAFAAFQVLLHRYTGQDELLVATPIANRQTPELESLVGLFFNTLVLRTDCGGDPSFATLLDRVRDVALDAYAHQDLPFVKLVEMLRPERALSHNPLVQVMFILQNAPHQAFKLPGLEAEISEVDNGTAQFDLIMSLRADGDGMAGYVHYDTDLFEASTLQRLIGHYKTLLQSACADPAQRLSALAMLTPRELWQVRFDWNDTAQAREAGLCLHTLVERQVAAQPDAPAVLFGDQHLSYRTLDMRANQLAHRLIALGAQPGARVGLCLRPGPDMVIALLATVKTGSAYVPLDPDYPAPRLQFMLKDAEIAVLVSSADLLQGVAEIGQPVLCLDATTAADEAQTPPSVRVSGEHLAYVIYTSGTTGQPKGVMVRHTGIVNNLLDLNDDIGVTPADRVLALSSFSFDMFVYETFGILAAGGAVVIPEAGRGRDPAHWAELITRHGVSIWNSAPALLEMLLRQVESTPGRTLPSLRAAILGGDWVPVPAAERFHRMAPGSRFIVLGGATEASIHSIIETVEAVDPSWTSIPYGKPMVNQRAYVLDPALRPVPVGVPGELYLAGLGLARGYYARSGLTAEKFLPDPYVDVPGARMYRTGDLARLREDGTIILIGRIDHQVKIRGHRIELGEIEAVLGEHPSVHRAVVSAVPDLTGEKRLVAWLVLREGATDAPEAILAHARHQLPGYMVPAQVVRLDKLPLSPNGKVDRRALPDPLREAPPTDAMPVTALQRFVAALFADVLGVAHVGLHADFFDLGGHSLRATQLTAQVMELLQIELSLRSFLMAPNVAAVAAELDRIATAQGVSLEAILESLEAQDESLDPALMA